MSLNNAKSDSRKNLSIRAKLTLFYSIAAFCLLAVITAFLYWESINILYKADYQFLADEVETIQNILKNKKADNSALKQAVITIPTQHGDTIYRNYIRILNENNEVIIETPGISQVLPLENFQEHITKPLYKPHYRWYTNNKIKYLLIEAPLTLRNGKSGLIQISLDINNQHTLISDRKFIFLVVLIGSLCSLWIGFLVSHRGMKSLYVLTDTVKQITGSSLNQRVDPKSLPKELASLGIAFNQMLDRLESSFTRLKQFSSDLAHELRIPINNLIGETEIALSSAPSVENYQQLLMSNLEEYQRVSQLIENILFLSRAENPQLELQMTRICVEDEIAFICDYYQAIADEKNITVQYQGQATIFANSIMFRRMISNILSNALKYTENNGSIQFTIAENEGHTKITLQDNGIGISAEHLPKLFDRFYRVDSARSNLSGGVGLGLAIVKSIVDLHQGSITIHSIPNQGTTIEIVLP